MGDCGGAGEGTGECMGEVISCFRRVNVSGKCEKGLRDVQRKKKV